MGGRQLYCIQDGLSIEAIGGLSDVECNCAYESVVWAYTNCKMPRLSHFIGDTFLLGNASLYYLKGRTSGILHVVWSLNIISFLIGQSFCYYQQFLRKRPYYIN